MDSPCQHSGEIYAEPVDFVLRPGSHRQARIIGYNRRLTSLKGWAYILQQLTHTGMLKASERERLCHWSNAAETSQSLCSPFRGGVLVLPAQARDPSCAGFRIPGTTPLMLRSGLG